MNLRLLDSGLYQIYKNLGAIGISYDTEENEEKIIFTMSVPGMTDVDVDVRIRDGRRLTVKSLRRAKYTPEFHYAFVLPCKVIKKETYATVKNGVLTVYIQKAEPDEYKIELK